MTVQILLVLGVEFSKQPFQGVKKSQNINQVFFIPI